MKTWGTILLLLMLLRVAGWAENTSHDIQRSDSQMIVSVYNDAGVPAPLLQRAEDNAGRLFRRADLDLIWVTCSKGVSGESVCPGGTRSSQIYFHVISQSLTLSDNAFGVAFLGSDGVGRYADLFFDPIQKLATNFAPAEAEIMGSVMAHEIGHLLLGSQAHSHSGIMEAHWSSQELRNIAEGNLAFTRPQCQKMLSRVAAQAHAEIESLPLAAAERAR